MTKVKEHTKGILLLLLCSIIWSSGGVFIKMVEWSPQAVAGIRSLIAALTIGIVLGRKIKLQKSSSFWIATISYALTVTLFVTATKMTTAANAIFLQSTAPIWVALLGAWFFKEKIRKIDWITIGVVFIGLYFFFPNGIQFQNRGDIIAVASGITFALFILSMRKERDGSPISAIVIGNILAFLFSIPSLTEGPSTSMSWVFLIFLGVVQLGLSYFIYTKAIRHVEPVETSLILLLEPLLNPIWVFLVIGEKPSINSLVGGSIVLAAVTLRSILLSTRKRPKNLEQDSKKVASHA